MAKILFLNPIDDGVFWNWNGSAAITPWNSECTTPRSGLLHKKVVLWECPSWLNDVCLNWQARSCREITFYTTASQETFFRRLVYLLWHLSRRTCILSMAYDQVFSKRAGQTVQGPDANKSQGIQHGRYKHVILCEYWEPSEFFFWSHTFNIQRSALTGCLKTTGKNEKQLINYVGLPVYPQSLITYRSRSHDFSWYRNPTYSPLVFYWPR